ncbi:hypothetical protein [Leptospira kanakyensis]|uniref:Lipoprotein n=1 Tax=Leptospira kanakyensis TaxID=2484968 RepID=A0A6N4QDU2_9LEPT|nr:hypothetical protein [Leptospira kanakyensis]MCW7468984.1 hypothetical protein [Leptospira kanakyensis]MCW7479971.1 hypothetical protein [Leptospira kanakyensis]TGK50195.1 hypothetical protein EHQ11_10800 [Leptospira kanakyensis]TGK64204.1 hypothetical protein EHQ16_07215 [Leptospira kanakyensis]TGK69333.1 hypothetical protein EHQ18_10960 [Leptospira kanakyensis]
MRKPKYYVLFLTLLLSSCGPEIGKANKKCDKEKKKSNECLLTAVLACEKSPDAERYRKLGVNICTNIDGYVYMIQYFCDVPEECKSTSKSE